MVASANVHNRLPAPVHLPQSLEDSWVTPMLATLTDRYFSDPDWIFERKLDGERCLVFSTTDGLALMSRNKGTLSAQYPELVAAFESQTAADFIVDGEIVAFDGTTTSFSRLQRRTSTTLVIG